MEIPQSWIDARCQPAQNIVLHQIKAIYIPISKVATTSVKTAIAAVLGVEGNVHFEAKWPHVSKRRIRIKFPDYYVFSFVRNPWDRVLSCYLSKLTHPDDNSHGFRNGVEFNFWKYGDRFYAGMSFADFVHEIADIPDPDADIHFASQYLHLTDEHGNLLADFIGKFETLRQDLAQVCDQLSMPPIILPELNKTKHAHYSQYFIPETSDLLASRYEQDIALFGYQFEKNP
jgi:chondroitin 4-sulfotransferase 11